MGLALNPIIKAMASMHALLSLTHCVIRDSVDGGIDYLSILFYLYILILVGV